MFNELKNALNETKSLLRIEQHGVNAVCTLSPSFVFSVIFETPSFELNGEKVFLVDCIQGRLRVLIDDDSLSSNPLITLQHNQTVFTNCMNQAHQYFVFEQEQYKTFINCDLTILKSTRSGNYKNRYHESLLVSKDIYNEIHKITKPYFDKSLVQLDGLIQDYIKKYISPLVA